MATKPTTRVGRKSGSTLKNSQRLTLDKHNYRLHPEKNQTLISDSLKEVGPFRSIGVDGDNIVRAGNGVFTEAEKLGLRVTIVDAAPDELIAVRRKDLKGKKAERAGLFDNATAESSEWDYARIADLANRERAQLTGIKSDAEINAIIRRAEADQRAKLNGMDATEDSVIEHDENLKKYTKKWAVKKGDVWEANGHLVICGDCTDPAIAEFVGHNVQLVFTSPPYADRRDETYGGIPADKYVEWWANVQRAVGLILRDDGSFLLNIKAHCDEGQRNLYVMDLVLDMVRTHGWKFIDELCWTKVPLPGDFGTRFKNAFEPVYHFSKTVKPSVYRDQVATYSDTSFTSDGRKMAGSSGAGYIRGGINKSGLVYPSNVVHAVSGKIGGHPAAFPTSLADFFVEAYSPISGVVCDPFAGSGTTLISTVRKNRIGVAIERDPRYVAFILERLSWEELSPIKMRDALDPLPKKGKK